MLKNFQVGWKLREKIESGRVKLDIGGHFRSISLNDDFIKSHLSIKLKATPSQLKELDKAIETEVPLNNFIQFENYTRADIYSFIDWIRDPDPVRDFQGEWMALNFTAGQIIQDKLTGQYSDLYTTTLGKPVSKLKSIMKAADTLMCANGGGIDYHPNGWLGSNPDLTMDAPDLKIPRFQGKHRWYPMSDWSLLAKTAGIGKDYNGKGPIFVYMNPSFIELAFNICQNIIRFGSESMYTDKKHDHCKSNIMLAKKCFKALVKRFPTQVPSYCKGLIE